MFVMRYKAGGPSFWKEYAYKETVNVYNKITVVRDSLTVEYLTNCAFELLGEIGDESQLQDFLQKLEEPKKVKENIYVDAEKVLVTEGGQGG